LFDDIGHLAATGSLVGKIIQGVAVEQKYDGEGLLAKILTVLLRCASERGIWHLVIFTKPEAEARFASLGFKTVVSVRSSALLEWGRPDIGDYLAGLAGAADGNTSGESSCVVVNCNPFTLGHRYLIEKAASLSRRLYVLVVEEDRSEFPSYVRFRLVRDGVEDIGNVSVLRGGEYVISNATFPSYFTRESELASAHAELDIEIFASRVAPALSVNHRFVGTEPFSRVTSIYNDVMKRILPARGIRVSELERLDIGGEAVSASRVRALLKAGNIGEALKLVPLSTRNFFDSGSDEFRQVLEKLRSDDEKISPGNHKNQSNNHRGNVPSASV
jgi:[citrate (pro-3S)-lyase] ligase